MQKAFKMYDIESKGKITVGGMVRAAKELGENLSKGELQGILDEPGRGRSFSMEGNSNGNEENGADPGGIANGAS